MSLYLLLWCLLKEGQAIHMHKPCISALFLPFCTLIPLLYQCTVLPIPRFTVVPPTYSPPISPPNSAHLPTYSDQMTDDTCLCLPGKYPSPFITPRWCCAFGGGGDRLSDTLSCCVLSNPLPRTGTWDLLRHHSLLPCCYEFLQPSHRLHTQAVILLPYAHRPPLFYLPLC